MAKRFTDTEKWKKPFLKSLPVEYKVFWMFLLDECDNAGIWHVEPEIAELRLGISLSLQKALGLFGERVVEFDSKTKWFIPDFITFQYVSLNAENKALRDVIIRLEKYDLVRFIAKNKKHQKGGSEGGSNPPMDKDKDKDKEIQGFEKFKNWILTKAPNVAKMKEPFSLDQYMEVKTKFKNDVVQEILTAMHNHAPLLKKNVSAYLTLCSWIARRNEAPVKSLPKETNGLSTLKKLGA